MKKWFIFMALTIFPFSSAVADKKCCAEWERQGLNVVAVSSAENQIQLPSKIPLEFRTAEGSSWNQDIPIDRWEKLKTVTIGSIEGIPVKMDLYLEKGNPETFEADHVHGVIDYQGQVHKVLFLGYIPEDIVVYPLSIKYKKTDSDVHLVGGVGSPISGICYLFFDEEKKVWGNFHLFGVPLPVDINEDGKLELIIDFRGIHLNQPDVYVIRWNGDHLEETNVNDAVKKVVPSITYPLALVSTFLQELSVPFSVRIAVSQLHPRKGISAIYQYKDDTLVKVSHE